MLTVVEDPHPGRPTSWQKAASICISEIFQNVTAVTGQLEKQTKGRIISSAGPELADDFDEELICVLDGLGLLDIQFEGMLNSSVFSPGDGMYWVEEWKILGRIAAGAGIKNGQIFPNTATASGFGHPEMQLTSASSTFAGETIFLESEISAILARKQHDYGPANITRFGRHGLMVRCHDKIARLKNLHLSRSGQAANEALSDTYIDIIGYATIGMMLEREWFLIPLDRNSELFPF